MDITARVYQGKSFGFVRAHTSGEWKASGFLSAVFVSWFAGEPIYRIIYWLISLDRKARSLNAVTASLEFVLLETHWFFQMQIKSPEVIYVDTWNNRKAIVVSRIERT